MFELTNKEFIDWRSQIVMSKSDNKGLRHRPYAFTEQGVAMLSGVLSSERAIEVNILIMRAFVKLREMIASHKGLAKRLDELEKKYDAQFKIVFDAIRQLMAAPEPREKKIGFRVRERIAGYRTSSRSDARQDGWLCTVGGE